MFDLVKQITRPDPVPVVRGTSPRLLLFSMRRVADLVASCALYELEDLISNLVPADRIEPEQLEAQDFLRKLHKLGRWVTGSATFARSLTPQGPRVELDRDYDLFLPVFNHPYELFALDVVPNWRERCRHAACFINEVWEGQIPEYLLERLAQFDRIYLGVTRPTTTVARITGRPCSYLPPGVDCLSFAPDLGGERPIHVCGIGRRSEITHRALLSMARQRGLFYYFDTVRARSVANASRQVTFSVGDPAQHRFLYASMLKRSRYFMASRARANEPELIGDTQETAGRFFEGAAAGTVMIGEPPRNSIFDAYFDWPDAVIRIPFDSPDIADVIDALDADPDRLARIANDNVVGSLRKSDWLYRLEQVFQPAAIAPTAAMTERHKKLRALVERFAPPERVSPPSEDRGAKRRSLSPGEIEGRKLLEREDLALSGGRS